MAACLPSITPAIGSLFGENILMPFKSNSVTNLCQSRMHFRVYSGGSNVLFS
uniref:Uncharacterized protein n=1 Tax=Arundo donax TaxID=35708 RepID=A0A0A9GYE6_ARUDO